jgi:hypothetical protein
MEKEVKVKLMFTLLQAMVAQRGSRDYSSTLSLISSVDGLGGQRHALAALPPGKRPGTRCIGGWVGPRAGRDGCGKSPSPPPPPEFDHQTVQPVVSRYTDWAIPAHFTTMVRALFE